MSKEQAAPEGHEEGEGTDLWLLIAAPVIWSAHFLACYVAVAVYCAKAGRDAALDPMVWVVLGMSALAIGGIGFVLLGLWRVRGPSVGDGDLVYGGNSPEERHRFLTHVAITLCVLSIVGVLYVTLPVLAIDTCR